MSLITRCPACATMFKVVPDQLRVSEGWVRCGHCAEVFDASAHIQDEPAGAAVVAPVANVPVESPPAELPTAEAPTAQSASEPVPEELPPVEPAPQFEPLPPPEPVPDPEPATSPPAISPPAWPQEAADAEAISSVRWETEVFPALATETPAMADPVGMQVSEPAPPLDSVMEAGTYTLDMPPRDLPLSEDPARDALLDDDAPLPEVSFVRDAQRKAFWRRPVVRAVLGVVAALLLLALGAQMVLHERDRLAVMHPGLKPWLDALCQPLQCTVSAPRQIESIVIDSSSFVKMGNDAYRLSFSLKNLAATAVAMPALELTLTDVQDQVVLRRVLLPAEFGAPGDSLAGAAEWAGSLALTAVSATGGPARVAGYRVLAFYP